MIDMSYMQVSRLLEAYYHGCKDPKIKKGELSEKAYLTEQLFT